MVLRPQLPQGYELLWLEEVDSTNSEALRQSQSGRNGPLWIVANCQTQGRGRRGREWIAKPGNLFATLLLSWPGAVAGLSDLSFVAAVACAKILDQFSRKFSGDLEVSLKWPNDVLLFGSKVGGILIETSRSDQPEHPISVAIGIGLNIAAHPQNVGYPTTDLAQHGISTTNVEVMELLAQEFDNGFSLWQGGRGFEAIKRQCLEYGPDNGQELAVNTGSDIISGAFDGLDERGGLRLVLSDGSRKIIIAGDVISVPIQARQTGA